MLGVGLAVTLAGCADPAGPAAQPGDDPHLLDPTESDAIEFDPTAPDSAAPAPPAPPGPPVITGAPQILRQGPVADRRVALTVDDGFCATCVAGYVAFAKSSGTHLTFCPNGVYAREWAPHAPVLRPLIAAGQVQLMNHTFDHRDLTVLSGAQIRAELERNEDWIAQTFGTTTRPYFRPPYGRHNAGVQQAAAAAGFRVLTLWNGSYSDSRLITPQFLMAQASRYLRPGTIMIGHANHPIVLGLFDQILDLIKQRDLHPVTMDEMFGTRRPPARH